MDAPSAMTLTQLLLLWTLLSVLLIWMFTFLILAVRPATKKRRQGERISPVSKPVHTTASAVLSMMKTQPTQPQPVVVAPHLTGRDLETKGI